MKKIITLVLLFVYFQNSIFALHTFIGTVDDQWDNSSNWDMGTVPTSSDDVEINASCLVASVEIPIGFTTVISNLLINDGKELSVLVEGSLTISTLTLQKGTLNIDGYLLTRVMNIGTLVASEIGTVNINGNLEFNNGTSVTMLVTRGTVNNYNSINGTGHSVGEIFLEILADGEFNNFGDVTKTNSTGAILENKGVFNNEIGGNLNFTPSFFSGFAGAAIGSRSGGVFTNKGNIHLARAASIFVQIGVFAQGMNSFINESTGNISIYDARNAPIQVSSNSSFVNNGSLYIEKSAFTQDMIVGNASTSVFTNASTGTLSGEGKVRIDNFDFEGNLSPGNSPGKVAIESDFDLNNVTYLAELEGTSGAGVVGGHDLIEVTGTADLTGGILTVTTIGGFTPVLGNQFSILTATTSVAGTFASMSLPTLSASLIWDVTYNPTSVVLEVISNPLPVELISFYVKEKSNTHELIWSTASETNTSHFEIEYSLDGNDWEKVGRVSAFGESNSIKIYSFENTWDRFANHHYYRLKIIDFDYTFEYSDIQSVRSTSISEVKIFPNPFSNNIQINIPGSSFEILNAQNQVVYQSNHSNENVDLSHLSNGLYLIKYQIDGKPVINKIIKSNN